MDFESVGGTSLTRGRTTQHGFAGWSVCKVWLSSSLVRHDSELDGFGFVGVVVRVGTLGCGVLSQDPPVC